MTGYAKVSASGNDVEERGQGAHKGRPYGQTGPEVTMPGALQHPVVGYGREADVYRWSATEVLKLFHPDQPPDLAAQEWRCARRVQAFDLPVPAVLELRRVAGRRGLVFQYIAGPTMLQQFDKTPWRLFGLIRLFADLHAAIHQYTVTDLPSQREHYADLIRQATLVPTATREVALAAMDALPDGNHLCHGDFHPDQIILNPQGPMIIDWLTACRGNPLADVALTALILEVGNPPDGRISGLLVKPARSIARSRYLHRYVTITGADREQLAAWQLPMAVARVSGDFAGEAPRLLPLIGNLAAQHTVYTRRKGR